MKCLKMPLKTKISDVHDADDEDELDVHDAVHEDDNVLDNMEMAHDVKEAHEEDNEEILKMGRTKRDKIRMKKMLVEWLMTLMTQM